MKWYAAHAVLYVRFKDGRQDSYPVWENVYLIQAKTVRDGLRKARRRARQDEGDSSGSFTWDGRPATWVFAGVRKLIECSGGIENRDGTPQDGVEVTYSEMELRDEVSLKRLVAGDPVTVLYEQ